MSRLRPYRQQGFGLLVFVVMASIVALSIVLGYSGLLTNSEANRRPAKLRQMLDENRSKILNFYEQHAGQLDNSSLGNPYTADDVVRGANVQLRYGLRAAMSKLLPGDSGLFYRRIVLYYPSETDATNPPDLATFTATGNFTSCASTSSTCAERIFVTFDSLTIQKEAMRETQHRLERVAIKAQSYFKARMMLDPEKNISVNYFRPPFGSCITGNNDLQCLDNYTPLALVGSSGWVPQTNIPQTLGLTNEELVSGWGDPIEASNKFDSETVDPPFTMVFRVPSPFGGYFSIRAVQQI